jgi:ring-1,2-phenylacetyl-CoA epoxidase subunit PaaB
MDTQWPRFEVFKQDTPEQPYQNIGTVHAPDAEIALLNARDVYGRRPNCHSLWVAPEKAILKVTAEELANPQMQQKLVEVQAASGTEPTKTYKIFQKLSQKRSMTFVNHVGEVEAASGEQALVKALQKFAEPEVWVWWVCPAGAITASEPGVEDSWFAPAIDKVYRQQSYYGKVKRKRLDERLQIAEQLSQEQSKTEVAQ